MHLTTQRTLAQEAASLASGTLATLTGYRDTALLDEIQAAFTAWCRAHPAYPTWQAAWDAWQKTRNPQAPASRHPVQQRLDFGFTLEG